VILVDSNIPMYLVGAAHPNKDAARRLLEHAIRRDLRLVTDAEVLQEILHRYTAIRRLDAIQPALDALLGVVDIVYPIEGGNVEQAKTILLGRPGLSARNALHVAIMMRFDIELILSFDTGFDGIAGIRRFEA
jgi:uncharacterized protein